MMNKQAYFYGTGRRKTAVARVRVYPGSGAIIVNGTPFDERFPAVEHQSIITKAFNVSETMGKYNVEAKVSGGGIAGQSGALSHGISRALIKADESLRPLLKQKGLLTRDSREKERNKPGLKRARKAPQYTKR
ncbi:30S ribosomal protein S9 [Chloroflexota bacterium]